MSILLICYLAFNVGMTTADIISQIIIREMPGRKNKMLIVDFSYIDIIIELLFGFFIAIYAIFHILLKK